MSSSDIAFRVDGLGKRYRLGFQDGTSGSMYRYKSLRDSLGGWTRHPLRTARQRLVRGPITDDNAFWALKDVSFEVKRGEVVGIIGRNGAGKSTLLKILSRITKPTNGRVDLFGRVGSLLEVGTGFHPELSGRENIYLNGAILGMSHAEVRGRFDEIVNFSEIEKFIDTPVKQYSSGMYMRLAFAIAAYLETEILVVDEVLAVGDAVFQKKCLGKMQDTSSRGNTVLFVSHNLPAVTTLCETGIVLSRGKLEFIGKANHAAAYYLHAAGTTKNGETLIAPVRPANAHAWIKTIELLCDNQPSTTLKSGGNLSVKVAYDANGEIQPSIRLILNSIDGVRLIHSNLRNMGGLPTSVVRKRTGEISVTMPRLNLTPGDYELTVCFGDSSVDHQILPAIARICVEAEDVYGSGMAYSGEHSHLWWPLEVNVNGVGFSYESSQVK